MATFIPNFNLYGPTPSAAASQQAPWTAFYTQQNNVNEQNRAQAVLQSIRLEEIERARAQEAARFNALARLDATRYAQRQADQALADAEERRRFDLGLKFRVATEAAGSREQRRQFDESAKIKREEIAARREQFEPPATATEILAEQIDALNSETARVIAKQVAAAENLKQQVTRGARLSAAERAEAMRVDDETASLIARGLAERIGRLPPQVRFDSDRGEWTTSAPASRGFTPAIGGLRMAERTESASTTRNPGVPFTMYGRGGQTTNAIDFSQPAAAPATRAATRDWVNEPPLTQEDYDSIPRGQNYLNPDTGIILRKR